MAPVSLHSVTTELISYSEFSVSEADHEKQVATRHWINERVVAVALLPVIPIALAFPNPALDNLLITSVVLHTHW